MYCREVGTPSALHSGWGGGGGSGRTGRFSRCDDRVRLDKLEGYVFGTEEWTGEEEGARRREGGAQPGTRGPIVRRYPSRFVQGLPFSALRLFRLFVVTTAYTPAPASTATLRKHILTRFRDQLNKPCDFFISPTRLSLLGPSRVRPSSSLCGLDIAHPCRDQRALDHGVCCPARGDG